MNSAEHHVTFLTRAECGLCRKAKSTLDALQTEYGFSVEVIDVDAVVGERPELRAEYGDRVPVVLLDGREHSYWELDEARFRRDIEG